MATTHYNTAVIGLGAMGSSTLYQAARRGLSCIGIDLHQSPHSFGSSHGESRLIRMAYYEHPDYVPLLRYSYSVWDELADESQTPLRNSCGLLLAGDAGAPEIVGTIAAAALHHLPLDQLSANAARNRFPLFRFRDNDSILWEPSAGFLYAERCIQAMLKGSQSRGAAIQVVNPRVNWSFANDRYLIQDGSWQCTVDHIVFCLGPWTAIHFPVLASRLAVHRVPLFWYEARPQHQLASNQMPCFGFIDEGQFIYGMPAITKEGVKLGWHEVLENVTDPSQLDRSLPQPALQQVDKVVNTRIPSLSGQFRSHRMCMYTMSTDRHFIVDCVKNVPRSAVGCGFSGHGFKLAPAIGRILLDYALDGKTSLPAEFLRTSRWT